MAQPYGFIRKAFRVLNKGFMVPAFRLGLGPILGSPFGGYIMVIKNRGHKSGKLRYTPVNYAIANGLVYCIAGFGKRSHWIKNLASNPQAELLLPGGALAASAEVVEEEREKLGMLRQILINSGFAAVLFEGIIASRVSEEKLREMATQYIVLRFRPVGLGSGPADQGGWLWVWPVAATIAILWLLLK
ncbi:MAG: nitroreductase/quinone reductase family protein [Anaerolineales bacterium]